MLFSSQKKIFDSISIKDIFDRKHPETLLNNSFYVEIFQNKTSLKLQKELSRVAHLRAAQQYRLSLSQVSQDVTKNDVIMSLAKTKSAHILRASLSQLPTEWPQLTLEAGYFSTYLSLNTNKLGYETEQCLHEHGIGHYKLLDVHANYANSGCLSTFAGLHKRHTSSCSSNQRHMVPKKKITYFLLTSRLTQDPQAVRIIEVYYIT